MYIKYNDDILNAKKMLKIYPIDESNKNDFPFAIRFVFDPENYSEFYFQFRETRDDFMRKIIEGIRLKVTFIDFDE